jgi:hypothetical protein
MSPRRSAATTTQRIGVPALFTEGQFEQVLILTFGADLEFYERGLRRHLGAYRNQIVLADGPHLERNIAGLAATGSLRHLNRSWLAAPLRTRHAAHAKAILLAGPEAGTPRWIGEPQHVRICRTRRVLYPVSLVAFRTG